MNNALILGGKAVWLKVDSPDRGQPEAAGTPEFAIERVLGRRPKRLQAQESGRPEAPRTRTIASPFPILNSEMLRYGLLIARFATRSWRSVPPPSGEIVLLFAIQKGPVRRDEAFC